MAAISHLFSIKKFFTMNIIPLKVWEYYSDATGSLIDIPQVTLFIKHLNVSRNPRCSILFCFVLFCSLFVCLFDMLFIIINNIDVKSSDSRRSNFRQKLQALAVIKI